MELGWEALKDFVGWNDLMGCLDKDIGSCAMLAIGILPVGKGLKAVKALGKIVDGAISFYKQQKSARRILDRAGAACKANSFTPGTLVLLADGTSKPIEEVELGDEVLAADEATGKTTEGRAVTTLITGHGDKTLVTITVEESDGDQQEIVATDEHPFWVPSQQEWVNAIDLTAGDWLQTSAGTRVQIERVENETGSGQVHNLTVVDDHTYYVMAGGTPALVHNCNFAPGVADVKFDKHVLGLDDAGQPTRVADLPEYDIYDLDQGFDNFVADAKSLMCSDVCPAGARQAVRGDGVVVRLDAQGRLGMRDGNTITTYFRPDNPVAYFLNEAGR